MGLIGKYSIGKYNLYEKSQDTRPYIGCVRGLLGNKERNLTSVASNFIYDMELLMTLSHMFLQDIKSNQKPFVLVFLFFFLFSLLFQLGGNYGGSVSVQISREKRKKNYLSLYMIYEEKNNFL